MAEPFDLNRQRAIRAALAREAYRTGAVRIADPDLTGFSWLVSSPRGVFAVGTGAARLAIHGWFFGICRDGDILYLFENCGLRDRAAGLGRLLRLRIAAGRLVEPQVLASGLDANCHQLRVIDGLVCLVDTANQRILRFSPEGVLIDAPQPFPPAAPGDTSGAYLHLNSLARVNGRLALLLHNGKARPERPSELAWLDDAWQVTERVALAGYSCHDIVADERGTLWHSASLSGELIASDGRRIRLSEQLMTRGIAITPDCMAVGLSSFGPRQLRDSLGGALVILNRDLTRRETIPLDGPPADIAAL